MPTCAAAAAVAPPVAAASIAAKFGVTTIALYECGGLSADKEE